MTMILGIIEASLVAGKLGTAMRYCMYMLVVWVRHIRVRRAWKGTIKYSTKQGPNQAHLQLAGLVVDAVKRHPGYQPSFLFFQPTPAPSMTLGHWLAHSRS